MEIDLNGAVVRVLGEQTEIGNAGLHELLRNGAIAASSSENTPDILVVVAPLRPDEEFEAASLLDAARLEGANMFARGSGRILFLISAVAGVPMKRYPNYSSQMAAIFAGMRSLAMQLGPKVLVNAVGVGAVGDPLEAGDFVMLSHASVRRTGTVAEVVYTMMFFCDPLNAYTTGQMLSVDGGWTAGYGRNF